MNKKNIAIFLILLLSVIGLIVGVFSTELDEFHIENPKDSPISIKDDNNTFTISIKHKDPEIDIINILNQYYSIIQLIYQLSLFSQYHFT